MGWRAQRSCEALARAKNRSDLHRQRCRDASRKIGNLSIGKSCLRAHEGYANHQGKFSRRDLPATEKVSGLNACKLGYLAQFDRLFYPRECDPIREDERKIPFHRGEAREGRETQGRARRFDAHEQRLELQLSDVNILPKLQLIGYAARQLAADTEHALAAARERNLRRARSRKPVRCARLPHEAAGELRSE